MGILLLANMDAAIKMERDFLNVEQLELFHLFAY